MSLVQFLLVSFAFQAVTRSLGVLPQSSYCRPNILHNCSIDSVKLFCCSVSPCK